MGRVKVERPDKIYLEKLKVSEWPIWESPVKKFDWEYDDNEIFYVIEGKVSVETTDGEKVEFGTGDLVTFTKGVKCTWDVKEPIRKHYNFG
ncbi:MAG: cupin domain-containing protein [Candidatus Omnitrophota bacterium]